MRRPCGSTRPIVAWTSSTLCAGFGLPSATAPVSSVSRSGKYHSEPSAPFTPTPENIVANLEIGVIAPVPFHPWTGPADAMPVPRCAWAAIRAAGDVATFSANPNWATLETLTEGTRSAGSSPDALRGFVPALAALISLTLLLCGGFYTASEERISYVNLPDAPVEHSAFPELAGMATPGPYLPELDELLRYAQANIPQDDGLILIPGEDPFFFASGRVPRFPILLFDPTTDPYSPTETAALVRSQKIRWLIVKRDLQIKIDPTPDRAATMQALMGEFTLAAHLRGYDVYRR